MRVPPVYHPNFSLGFSLTKTNQLWGYPHGHGNTHVNDQRLVTFTSRLEFGSHRSLSRTHHLSLPLNHSSMDDFCWGEHLTGSTNKSVDPVKRSLKQPTVVLMGDVFFNPQETGRPLLQNPWFPLFPSTHPTELKSHTSQVSEQL